MEKKTPSWSYFVTLRMSRENIKNGSFDVLMAKDEKNVIQESFIKLM